MGDFCIVPAVDFPRGCIYQHYFAIKNQPKLLGFAWKRCMEKTFQGPSSPKWCFFFNGDESHGRNPKKHMKKQTLVIWHQLDACFLWKSLKQFPIDFSIKFDPPRTMGMPRCFNKASYFHRGLNRQDIPTNHLSFGTFFIVYIDQIGFPERLNFKTDKWKDTLHGRYGWNVYIPTSSWGGCSILKGWCIGIPYHPFSTPWKIQACICKYI